MYIIQKCVSDRHYLIRYPAFTAGENAKKREAGAVSRMNDFYDTLKNEIIAYCTELSGERPKVMYLVNTECTVTEGENERPLGQGDEIPLDMTVTIRIALILRNRPEPTRRLGVVHTWQGGYLTK